MEGIIGHGSDKVWKGRGKGVVERGSGWEGEKGAKVSFPELAGQATVEEITAALEGHDARDGVLGTHAARRVVQRRKEHSGLALDGQGSLLLPLAPHQS